jgi:AraC family transcriptional regulator
MMISTFLTPRLPDESSKGIQMAGLLAKQASTDGHSSTQFCSRTEIIPSQSAECDLLDAAVKVSPIDTVKRHCSGRYGIATDSIYAPAKSKIEFRFNAAVHLLVMYDEGARREGETLIEGLPPSRLRNFDNKFTFVPAGHAYHEWHETTTPMRVTYLYLIPSKFQKSSDADTAYVPRVFFEDSVLWETALKLRNVLEGGNPESVNYLQALADVLVCELSRTGQGLVRSPPVNRGGLAGWQMRTVTSYIEEHLGEQISLVTLARLTRLSQFHFCRAFKQSFGNPPHQYQVQRRIQRAKALLSDRKNSVTDVGLALGYCQTSSFTVAFRKIIGRAPRDFRRDFT